VAAVNITCFIFTNASVGGVNQLTVVFEMIGNTLLGIFCLGLPTKGMWFLGWWC
jgi:hypothetical protein